LTIWLLNDKINHHAEVEFPGIVQHNWSSGECALNEKRIQEVIEIEKQAGEAYNKAVKEADHIPAQADKEAKALIEKSRAEADAEAQEILTKSEPKEECDRIMAEAEKQIEHNQTLAKRNHDRAVTYVISRVLGRE
jgi:vacuolar-type H+-ATPase subunit H